MIAKSNKLIKLCQSFAISSIHYWSTQIFQHEIHVNADEIIKVKPYQLPFAFQEFVKEEVKKLLELDVIESSVIPFILPQIW